MPTSDHYELDNIIREGLDASPDCFGILGPDDTVVFCNSTFASAYGITKQEAIGKTNKELLKLAWQNKKGILIDTDDFEAWYENILRLQEEKQQNQFQSDFTDGRWFKMTRNNLANGYIMLFGVDITDLKETQKSLKTANQRIEALANTDPLTGVNNRRSFKYVSTKELQRAKRYQQPLSLLALDLDFFKRVNDTYGHDAGDYVLRAFSTLCLQELRQTDTMFRMGGEEFIIILPMANQSDAVKLAERLRHCVESNHFYFRELNQQIDITVSIGISSLSHAEQSIKELNKQADAALYKAKQSGRNRIISHNK